MQMSIQLKIYEGFNNLLSGLAQDICLYIGPLMEEENLFCFEESKFKIPDSRSEHLGEERDICCMFYCKSDKCKDLQKKWKKEDDSIKPLQKVLKEIVKGLRNRVCNYSVYDAMCNHEAWAENYILYDLIHCEKMMERYMEGIFKERQLPDVMSVSQLSAQRYEGRPISGRVLFVEDIKTVSQFINKCSMCLEKMDCEQRKWDIRNQRNIRKLMELVTEDSCLVVTKKADGWEVSAVMELQSDFEIDTQGTLVEFVDFLQWKIRYEKICWGCYRNGIYELEQIESGLYMVRLNEIAPQCGLEISEIIDVLRKEEHGTAAVFMEKSVADAEAKRLAGFNRCISLDPLQDTKALLNKLQGLTRIDGAMIIDLEGKCHAIGAILDGETQVQGKTSRGARYNSLNNYVHVMKNKKTTSTEPIFCVVVSEDKTIDILDGSA